MKYSGGDVATIREYAGYRDALRELDAKVSEVFGKKMSWGDLFTLERHMDGGSVRFWDGGEMKEHKLTQGNEAFVTQESIVEPKSVVLYLRA